MWQPKSILQLVLLGFLVVLLPVLGALAYAGRTLNQMSVRQRDHLEEVGESTELVQRLSKELADTERLARQYLLLDDPFLLSLCNLHLEQFRSELANYGIRGVDPTVQKSIDLLLGLKKELHDHINSEKTIDDEDKLTLSLLKALHQGVNKLRIELEDNLKQKVQDARERVENTQRRLTILGFTVIPGTLLLVGLFSVLITRPIREIDEVIKAIGTGVPRPEGRIRGPRDLQLVAQRLLWLKNRLHVSEASQERFLHHISHELKTPLATIKEGIELFADEVPGPLNGPQREVIGILQNGLQHFQVLINNLLDFNLLKADRVLNRENLDLRDLVSGIISQYRLTAQRKRLQFELLGEALTIEVDRSVLQAAIDNLISNAVHFSPEGGKVTVQWNVGDRGVTILVGDEGPGIPDEEMDKVFLPFYQGHARRVGPVKGTGLGLSVAKECVESHHGQINILESKQGAWFEILLPRKPLLGTT